MASENEHRLHDLLKSALSSAQLLPVDGRGFAAFVEILRALSEAFSDAYGQAVAYGLDTAEELAQLREAFAASQADFLAYFRQRLICQGKPILGFCGGFSTGKSTFLNVLVNRTTDEPLPTKATRDTAVPVFLLNGPAEELWIENHQGSAFLQAQLPDLRLFRHSEDQYFQPWSYLVRSLYLHSPYFGRSPMVFLDLPGHTAGAEDEQISLRSARQCDAIVYLLDITQGDLKDTDVKFLRQLKDLLPPVLVLLTKCDRLPPNRLAEVETKIVASLKKHEIPYVGPHRWSKDSVSWAQPRSGIWAVQDYAAQQARDAGDRRFSILERRVFRLLDLCNQTYAEQRRLQAEFFQQWTAGMGTPLAEGVFTRVLELTRSSRSSAEFIQKASLFSPTTFRAGDFSQRHLALANQWLTASETAFPGPRNFLTLYALYSTLKDAIDHCGFYSTLNFSSPPVESDQWYYEHIERIKWAYSAVGEQINDIYQTVKELGRQQLELAQELSERVGKLKKQLKRTYLTARADSE